MSINSLKMPDMSVFRGKFCTAPCALHKHDKYGVVKFRVREVPEFVASHGTTFYSTKPVHVPLDNQFGYPHSEIRAFNYQTSKHVSKEQYREEADLIWRANLLRACKIEISPRDDD